MDENLQPFPFRPRLPIVFSMDDDADHPVPPDFLASLDRSVADMKAGRVIDARTVLAKARERARQIEASQDATPVRRI